jgi:ubiquinol-cytochrome c reductase cytochrome c1 subunit
MKRKNLISKVTVFCVSLIMLGSAPAYAAGDAVEPPKASWSFDGFNGTYDKAALQRGLLVYRNVCAACHSLKYVAYRNLVDLGYTEGQVKAIASEYTVTDGPDDDGEMYERPARPSDRFVSPYLNKKQGESVNNGAYPPDLSLISKGRVGGPDYIYALLTGYDDSHAKDLLEGQYWNTYMAGHVIAMAPPLFDGQVSYEDGAPETVEQYSKDVAHFLKWTSDTKLETRKRAGVKVLIFLSIFAIIMYGVKKRVWADVDH